MKTLSIVIAVIISTLVVSCSSESDTRYKTKERLALTIEATPVHGGLMHPGIIATLPGNTRIYFTDDSISLNHEPFVRIVWKEDSTGYVSAKYLTRDTTALVARNINGAGGEEVFKYTAPSNDELLAIVQKLPDSGVCKAYVVRCYNFRGNIEKEGIVTATVIPYGKSSIRGYFGNGTYTKNLVGDGDKMTWSFRVSHPEGSQEDTHSVEDFQFEAKVGEAMVGKTSTGVVIKLDKALVQYPDFSYVLHYKQDRFNWVTVTAIDVVKSDGTLLQTLPCNSSVAQGLNTIFDLVDLDGDGYADIEYIDSIGDLGEYYGDIYFDPKAGRFITGE